MREELTALKLTWPDGEGDLGAVLCRTLTSGHLPVMPIAPDFIGEAVVLSVLAQPTASGGPERWQTWCRVVERCCSRDTRSTPVTLLHAFQNFGQHLLYGEALLAATDALIQVGLAQAEPELLVSLENALPHQTAELRTRAADVTHHLYRRLKADLNSGREEIRSEFARVATHLGPRLGDLGRRVEALEPAQEAVAIYRALATQHPDAFRPNLARSLATLGAVLEGNDQLVAAWESYYAGAKVLATDFGPDLSAFVSLMTGLVRDYLRLAATLDREPDEDLLQSVREVRQSLQQPTADRDSRNTERQD